MTNSRLYLFGIGGTGSRVIKALTLLLASGIKTPGYEIVPIIIDPDRANYDLERTIQILNAYQAIQEATKQKNIQGFFSTPITTLHRLQQLQQEKTQNPIDDGYRFDIDGTRDGSFGDFVDFQNLPPETQKMMHLLFGKKLLATKLDKGFYGNPSMGSIVLNQFKDSNYFKAFANQFTESDRIFIVSSIFGGTGAAGFPLLVKTIRQADAAGLPNPEYLKKANIGALTMLPYFGVEQNQQSRIEKGAFIAKTKAALSYYTKGVNNQVNSLYYLADRKQTDYPNNEGGPEQKNNAHFLEMVGALSIIDFLHDRSENGRITYKEYAISGDTSAIQFSHLADTTKRHIFRPLIQYTYCCKYWKEHLDTAVDVQPWSKGKGGSNNVALDKAFFQGRNSFYGHLDRFNNYYLEWLREMERQNRSFSPFNLDVNANLLHNMVNGIQQNKTGNIFNARVEWDYGLFDEALNNAEKGTSETDPASKLLDIFYQASENIYSRKFV